MDDDKKRLLNIVNASNPSIRKIAQPAPLQIQGSNAYNPQNAGGFATTVTREQPVKPQKVALRSGGYAEEKPKLKVSSPVSLIQAKWGDKVYGEKGFLEAYDKSSDKLKGLVLKTATERNTPDDQKILGWLKRNDRLGGGFMDFVEQSNDRFYGGLKRGFARTVDWVLPGVNTFGLENYAKSSDESNRKQLSYYTDAGNKGKGFGTFQKGIVDVASMVVPAAATEKYLRGTATLTRMAQGNRLGRIGTGIISNVGGGVPATGVEILQTVGRGDDVNIAQSAAIGAGADLVVPAALAPLGKLYRLARGGRPVTNEAIETTFEYLVRENDQTAIKTVVEAELGITGRQADELSSAIANADTPQAVSKALDDAANDVAKTTSEANTTQPVRQDYDIPELNQLAADNPNGIKIYHQTSEEAANMIRANGFRGDGDTNVFFTAGAPVEGRATSGGNQDIIELTIPANELDQMLPDVNTGYRGSDDEQLAAMIRDGINDQDITLTDEYANKLLQEAKVRNTGVGDPALVDELVQAARAGNLDQVGLSSTTPEAEVAQQVSADAARTTDGRTAEDLIAQAREQEVQYLSDIEAVAANNNGTLNDNIRRNAVKVNADRINTKIAQKNGVPPSDILRSTIITPNPAGQVDQIIADMQARGYQVWVNPKTGLPDVDNGYLAGAIDKGGYKDVAVKFTRGADDPVTKELLIITPNMYDAKFTNGGHAIYKARRELQIVDAATWDEAVQLNQAMRQVYAEADALDASALNATSSTSVPSNSASRGGNVAPDDVLATTDPSAALDTTTGVPSTIKNRGNLVGDVDGDVITGDPLSTDSVAKTGDDVNININDEVTPGTKTRGGQVSLANDPGVPIAVWEDIFGYTPVTNRAITNAAAERVAADQAGVYDRIRRTTGQLTNEEVAEAQVLLRKFIDADDMKSAQAVAQKLTYGGTDTARALQQYSALRKTTPEGAVQEAYKIIDEANERWVGQGRKYELSVEKKDRIVELAENVQSKPPTINGRPNRERQIAEALLAREVTRVVPAGVGEKLATAQVYAQLLNLKTAVRNIGGNTILAGGESISTSIAQPVDWIISQFTGQRTVARPRFIKKLGGFITGGKHGMEDVKLGIRTVGEGGRFDIKNDVFQNKVGRALDKLLGYELQVPDKAFYMAQYEETLDSLMRAQKVDVPTNEMLQIANEEALYATFQNNSQLAKILSGTKKGLNLGKKFGVGELVLKYPKTPGNIVSVGMDYSPWGFGKGLYQLVKSTEGLSVAAQREAARNIGRSLTGSGLIVGGYWLAKNGVITANPSTDKDVRSLSRSESVGAYSINLSALQRLVKGEDTTAREGDIVSNYDWAQPTAIALSMGASMADKSEDAENALNAFLESAAAGTDTITQQPVVKNVARFLDTATTSADRGGGVIPALADVAVGAPSSFAPSALRQTAQVVDPYVRQTYDPNPIKESFNRVRAAIPGASKGLPEYKNSFGESIERFEGSTGKRIFDSFINPAFVDEITRTPEGQMVFDIYNSTGETKQFPRVADKKYTINGESRELSADEYNKYQEYIGQKTKEAFSVLAQNQGFLNLPDEEKAKTMANLISDIGQAGRIEILGAEYKNINNSVKKILNDNVGDFTSKIPEKVDGAVAQYFEETAFMDDDTFDQWLRGEPGDVALAIAEELNADRPAGVNVIGESNEIAKLYADFKKLESESKWTKLEKINKREDLWKNVVKASHSDVANEIYGIARNSTNELKEFMAQGLIDQDALDAAIELDNVLYRSGLNRTMAFSKKFRNQYGYGIPALAESVARIRTSSGTGGGGSKKKRANVGAFKLRFNTNQATSAPDVTRVPTNVQFRVKKPKTVNVTPVQLKL